MTAQEEIAQNNARIAELKQKLATLEGSTSGYTDVSLPRFFTIAERVMVRRNIFLTDVDKEIFTAIYNIADSYK